jgi:hypothetical protein
VVAGVGEGSTAATEEAAAVVTTGVGTTGASATTRTSSCLLLLRFIPEAALALMINDHPLRIWVLQPPHLESPIGRICRL